MNRSLVSVLWVLFMVVSLPSALAQENDWPRTLPLEKGMVTIYAPQVDEMSDDVIHFRAALAYRETAGSEPVFGAGWFESRVEIDSSSRIVHPTDLKVTQTRFPEDTYNVQSELSAVLAQQSPAWNLDFSLDELEAALKTAETESRARESLNTAPPRIVYRDHPALLISIDGDPVLREIENSTFKAVINTPYPVIFNGRHYYLNAAEGVWYRASKATGLYQFEPRPPADIAAMVNADEQDAASELPSEPITAANAPEIVVSTEPAELIVTEGPAAFVPLVDDLLVLQNSDNDVFMHVSTQEFYIVLAGRWYRSGSLNGPWAYQPAEKLPDAFANIPRDSNQADSRVYVAGTEEAREAVLDAQVPQTAAVARGEVDIEVEYDGTPVYQPVDGTDMVYIENTGSTVLLSNGLYYLVEDGVWFVSSTPNGPWQVSDHRPAQVDTILPTSRLYNVKYVQVYDSTPDVVYVGYTPGYTGSYVYHDTIFYGSGWYYQPWVSPHYYYPRHRTWGFNVGYNYWNGWSFGLSWGWGPFSVSYYSGGYWHRNHYWHHRHYSHWGPHGYRSRPWRHDNRRYGHNDRGRDEYRSQRSNRNQRNGNLYRDGAQLARVSDTRDNAPRSRGGREQNYDAENRNRQRRTSPVSPSDLRVKADLRDANHRASQNTLLADNSGRVYREAVRSSGRHEASDQASGNSSAGRTIAANTVASMRQARTRTADNRNRQRSSPEVNAPVRQAQPRISSDNGRQRSSPEVNTPVRQAQPRIRSNNGRQRSSPEVNAPVRLAQPRIRSNNGRQRSSPEVNAPIRQAQPRISINNGRQRSSPEVNTPVRQAQPRISSYSARARLPQVAPAPVRQQYSSRASPPPQSVRHDGGNRAAPAQHAPQRSTQKSSGRRNGSDRGGNNRARDSRFRR